MGKVGKHQCNALTLSYKRARTMNRCDTRGEDDPNNDRRYPESGVEEE